MSEDGLIKLLKIVIVIGLCLLLLGHYLISYANLPQTMGVNGMIISAACVAIGLILSLPTKMYLTFLLVKRENDKRSAAKKNTKQD
ncbi:hypothetical protein LP316_13620 [Thalassotalea sp. LPB0316]|uniref:hypothetical protein n=1 Tax=Thalassotalea sp. LPB0316 TaxID=2769490 RepID=UPI001866412F|nr:hypothetical protein [Thalassotalea sp. LPB0316]QOL25321.1 hypothetical protein LP316_13620 [Thalassotalea sp. LPB0316]